MTEIPIIEPNGNGYWKIYSTHKIWHGDRSFQKMKATITKKVGGVDYCFEVEAQKGFDVFFIAGFLAAMPTKCKLCGSENIHLASNRAKGYSFVKMLCNDCNARAQVGQYKEGGYYWKEWEKYVAPAQTEQTAQAPAGTPPPAGSQTGDDINPNDIPF